MTSNVDTRLRRPWLYDLLFLLVLVLAGYLRLTGVSWGEGQGQHPDENTFSGVLSAIRAQKCADNSLPVDACPLEQRRWLSLGEYFDSQTSPLNPYNRGYGSFVYGNLPMNLIRVAVDLTNQPDGRMLGRQASAFADLFTIVFLYLIVARLYDRRVALLASLFSALAVMQIQQSHFFTTDLFVNTFGFLAAFFAVEILMHRGEGPEAGEWTDLKSLFSNPLFQYSLGFGVAYGMALASKLNIYPLAVLLPGAFVIRYFTVDRKQAQIDSEQALLIETETGSGESEAKRHPLFAGYWSLIIACLIVGGFAALVSFRIFQPYAFDGLGLDERWVADITQQRAQASGTADMPWSLQWARRSHLYSFTNLTVYGLGLPLGILAWMGFIYMGWRILKGEWQHAVLWGWTAAYFLWQSLQFNPTMRYQLPIYPLLVMMAAWVLFEIRRGSKLRITNYVTAVIGLIVLFFTAAWAFGFHSIYQRDEPRIAASRWIFQNIPGPINIQIRATDGTLYNQPLAFPAGFLVQDGEPYYTNFITRRGGTLEAIFFAHALDTSASSPTLSLTLGQTPDPTLETPLLTAGAQLTPNVSTDPRGEALTVKPIRPVALGEGVQYYLRIEVSGGEVTFSGATVANETDFDYGLPMRVDGYDGFGGIYRGENLQVYWDDNADKLERFVTTLDQIDYILVPTNHQYAQISRVPERYPLTAYYYRELMGCPSEFQTIPCYHEAQPGDHQGRLGFSLVAVFTTFPKLGNFEINDQYAEEAFTFYDHPKVLVFKKRADFDPEQVRASLSTVDLTKVVRLLPSQFDEYSNLQLPPERLATQRTGGTWSELFSYEWIQNRYPVVGLLVWYLFIFILGLATYPIIRKAMPGLADKGYPLSRALGVVLFGYFAWLAGSVGISVTRLTVAVTFGALLVMGAALAYLQRAELAEEWKSKRNYFLMIEGLFLFFFLVNLFIRLGNPDLWHPGKGGERPMDFSYFNAILKSTSFPPYDPWFAGGYLNYYYYGFVLVGMPVKLLGIVPTIAYNFILPTLFAMVGICAFSIGWNLLSKNEGGRKKDEDSLAHNSSLVAGLSASALAILLGNLGTIQLLYNKLQQLGALGSRGPFTWESTFLQRLTWATEGAKQLFNGASLLIGPGDWYWDPSRVIPPGPGNAITEFPLFTFLYSDLHAHMMVMPVALLSLAWALSVLKNGAWWQSQASPESERRWSILLSLLLGGLIIGAVYPTNLSDGYTYLLVGMVALAYSTWQYAPIESTTKLAWTAGAVIALYVLSTYLYLPYRAWYAQAYSALGPWKGPFTPLASYFTHWGVFLFIVVWWLAWETREWMANTPLSALKKLQPYQLLIEGALIALVIVILATQYIGTSVGWVALPIAAWAGVLLLNPRLTDSKRLGLFLIGTALFITILVEVVVVRGDIGRQNTIFKFYLQAWLMLAVSAGAALAWTLPAYFQWLPGWRAFWQTAMILLVAGAASFTLTGTMGKIRDRWIVDAPRTLDAMTFMNYAQYDDFGQRLVLNEDYRAIRWMQDNVQGSPVIVEANCTEYHWCTRFTIYTGLPGVVGWNWHQRQQRVFTSTWVEERVLAVGDFYNSIDSNFTRNFLKKYEVKYIVVGQLERAAYTPQGISKFERLDGELWRSVYTDGQTTIYEVLP